VERVTAVFAESSPCVIWSLALGAGEHQGIAAVLTELGVFGVIEGAVGARETHGQFRHFHLYQGLIIIRFY
jgi:hypothetical protein